MLKERYGLAISPDFRTYEFDSVGPKGVIRKVVEYQEIFGANMFNLTLGDMDVKTGIVDYHATTNNNDSQKVLATVVSSLFKFMEHFPESIVFAEGNTASRTRLYQIGISNNLAEIDWPFHIEGLTEDGWENFRRGVHYFAFSVKRKV